MKRTRVVATDGPLYSPEKDLDRIESKLYEICKIAGIEEENLDNLTIDELVNTLRITFFYSSPKGASFSPAAIDLLRQENFHLVIQARKYWWYRQLAKGAQSRG
jgi:hypothetical protein